LALPRELSDDGFQPDILPYEARFTLAVLGDLKGVGGMRQALVPPLVIRGLTALVFVATFRHGFPLEAFKYDHRVGVGSPLASVHG
jgi:hypothetical protein